MISRKRLFVATLTMLLAACSATSLYLWNPPLKSGQRSPDGKQQGPWTYWFDHQRQQLQAKGTYADDRQVGTWTYWYPGGNKEWEGVLTGEQMQGPHTFWYENGQIRASGEFVDGLQTGHWTFFTPQGAKYREGDYELGLPSGEWTYFYADGEKLAAGSLRKGLETGAWSFWNESGEEQTHTFAGERGEPAPAHVDAWLLAEVDKYPQLPFRAQPWTENDEKYAAYNVARYRDGAKKAVAPAGSPYARRAKAKIRGRDTRRSDELIGRPLSEFGFKTGDGEDFDLQQYRGRRVVLVILRGMGGEVCVYCVGQTIALADKQPEFAARGAEIVLVYPGGEDRLPAFLEGYKKLQKREGEPPFPVVCDADTSFVRSLGIQANLALPTTLVLDDAGNVRWAYVGLDREDRPSADEILRALDDSAGR